MDLSERDKERLRKLAELYERDDLSDAEYRNRYNEIVESSRGTSELQNLGRPPENIEDSASQANSFRAAMEGGPSSRDEQGSAGQSAGTKASAKPGESASIASGGSGKSADSASGEPGDSAAEASIENLIRRSQEEPISATELSDLLDEEAQSNLATEEKRPERSPTAPLNDLARRGGFEGGRERQDSIIRPPNHASPTLTNKRLKQPPSRRVHIKRKGGSLSKLLVVPAIFSFGIVVALAFGYARSATITLPQFGQDVQPPKESTAVEPVVDAPTNLIMEPLFGEQAVERCSRRCYAWTGSERKTCLRGCQRYSLTAYGRRITLTDLDPKADSEKIAVSCFTKPISKERFSSDAEWRNSFSTMMELALRKGHSGAAKDPLGFLQNYYEQIKRGQSRFKLPPEMLSSQDEIAETALRASCLKGHLALTQIAITTVEQRSDEFSWEFYNKLYQALTSHALKAETRLLRAARDQGLR